VHASRLSRGGERAPKRHGAGDATRRSAQGGGPQL
jgi:hypothetical protein